MNLTLEPVCIDETPGFVFKSANSEGFCFVPQDCLNFDQHGRPALNARAYLVSGWARKNAMFNACATGRMIFPDTNTLQCGADNPGVSSYLHRLRRMA